MYVGIEDGTKSYRLLDSESQKLQDSCDVFVESEGWNWYKNKEDEATTPKNFTVIKTDILCVNLETSDGPGVFPENSEKPYVKFV